MVYVRFFGLIRIQLKEASTHIAASTIDDLLLKLENKYDINLKELKSAVIFLNGRNIAHLRLYKTELQEGDSVDILSPAGGG